MDNTIHICEEIHIINGLPFAIINDFSKSINYLILGDIHLGQSQAINFGRSPKFGVSREVQRLVSDLEFCIEKYSIGHVIFNGDIKHNTNSITVREAQEINLVMKSLLKKQIKITVILGNHDPKLGLLMSEFDEINLLNYYRIARTNYNIIIAHGHSEVPFQSTDILIMSHEHPAYCFRDGHGLRVKIPAFVVLYAKNVERVILLPASNKISSGVEFPVSKHRFLSPLLRDFDYSSIQIFPFDSTVGVLSIPKTKFTGNAL